MAKKSAVVLPELEKEIKFRTYYDNSYTDRGTDFDLKNSLTDQDYKMQTDINYLLEHMAGHSRTPIYGVQDNMTFEDWSNEMAMVKRRFLQLDEEHRNAFGNAQNFLKWCADPQNYTEQLPSNIQEKLNLEKINQDKIRTEEKEDRQAKKIAKAIKELS